MAEQGTERGQQVAQDAKEAKAQAKETVRNVAGAGRSDGARGAQETMTENLSALQGKAQEAAEHLRGMTPEDAQELPQSVLEWARKQPAYALGGALLLGFWFGRTWGRHTGHDE